MRWLIVLCGLGASAGMSCISSHCLRDADCPGSQVCREQAGACEEPECTADADCGHGKVCEERFCVVGCASQDDCASSEECVDRRCHRIGAECECPLAHEFCGTDINPNSPTAGTEVCVPGDFPDGVGLFFGSVYCGHCTGDYAALQQRQSELAADGLAPRMVWVQLTTALATPEDVGAHLGPDVTDPVIHDTDALRIWEAYGSTWYHFILVDAHGCYLTDHGPLDPTLVLGEEGEAIVSEWRDAMDEECPPPTP
ncbi:MAG: hypothetical protein HY905_07690 [Deltaproteobacteria bacterium]|nr:hypothetical protein [Deltaproteobacteria bacterium]